MAEEYRLEDHFCPACLDARHPSCDPLNWWCTCDCGLDGIAIVRRRRLPVQRPPLFQRSEGTER